MNYDSNPRCPENLIELAEFDKERYPEVYSHIWMGLPTIRTPKLRSSRINTRKLVSKLGTKRPAISPQMRTDGGFGLSLSAGVDFCCLVARTGPIVH